MMFATAVAFILAGAIANRKNKLSTLSWVRMSHLIPGILLGIVLMGISFLIIWVTGGVDILATSFTSDLVRSLLLQFGIFFLVACGEELFFRGFVYEHLKTNRTPLRAALISSVFFTIFHMGNPGIFTTPFTLINIFVIGMIFIYLKEISKSLWLPIGVHLAWNFSQGGIFGFHVSGEHTDSVLRTESTGPSIFNGGDFGAEGSLLTTVVVLLCCWICYKQYKKKTVN